LDIIINLLLDIKPEGMPKRTTKAKIQELADMGLSSTEIANVIGWAASSVSAELSKMKRPKKSGRQSPQ
jgi:IS30 family transposase